MYIYPIGKCWVSLWLIIIVMWIVSIDMTIDVTDMFVRTCTRFTVGGGAISLQYTTAVFAGPLLLENNMARHGGERVCVNMDSEKRMRWLNAY